MRRNSLFIILFILSIATPAYAFDVPTSPYTSDANTMLLIHWDEADGNTAPDDASSSNHTINNNGGVQTDNAQTKFSNVSLFDGTGDFWSIADSADFGFAGEFSLDVWIRINVLPTTNTNHYLFAGHAPFSFIFKNISDLYYLSMYAPAAGINFARQWTTPSTGTWYHILLKRNSSNDITIWVGGSQLGAALNDADALSQSNIAIGAHTGGSQVFNGWMDELRLSDIARFEPEEIGQFIFITKIWDYIRVKEAYASPLTIQYKEDTVSIDNPIVDSLCNDNRFRNLIKAGVDAINQMNYKELILIGTEAVKICISKLGEL